MEELLKQISEGLEYIKNNMDNLVTRQEVEEAGNETKESLIEELKRVADPLETIATGEAAATKEMLTGDVLLKSLFDGSEARLKKEIAEVKTEVEEVIDELKEMKTAIKEGFKALGEAQQKTAEILNAYKERAGKPLASAMGMKASVGRGRVLTLAKSDIFSICFVRYIDCI